MSKEGIVERIVADAHAEAAAIVKSAEERAEKTVAEAMSRAEAGRRATEEEIREKRESILSRRAAAARLEAKKIELAERRRVIDGVYAAALERLVALPKADALALTDRLLKAYAETGDTVYFAKNYAFVEDAVLLPVVKAKNLDFSRERIAADGGFLLKGKTSDKNLTYGVLLAADRDEYQASIAKELFKA